MTETTLAALLEQLTGRALGGNAVQQPKVDILRALIGARRTVELSVALKLCFKAIMRVDKSYTDADLKLLEELISQLGEIRFLRDRTAHFGISPQMRDGQLWWRSFNRWSVRDLDQAEELYFKIEHLEAASGDLETIRKWVWLAAHFGRPREQRQPWQYKPGELVKIPVQWESIQ